MGASETRRSAGRGAALRGVIRSALLATVALAAIDFGAARAETLSGALSKAYLTNPDINSQRAAVRQTDESVPEANAGYLPKVSAFGNAGVAHQNGNLISPTSTGVFEENYSLGTYPRGYGVQASQTDFRRLSDHQQDPQRRIAGAGRARGTAQHRAEHAAFGRHGVHGRSAELRYRRTR